MPDVTPRMLDPRFHGSAPVLPTPAALPVTVPSTPSAPAAPSGQIAQAGMAQRWEHLLRRSGLSRNACAVGMVLTGYAAPSGALGTNTPGQRRLSRAASVHPLDVRSALRELETHSWILRDPNPAHARGAVFRAITLTIPAHLQDPA